MRKIILGLGLMSIINSVFAQQVKYSDVEEGLITKRTEKFDSYVSKDGSVYKVGDVIKLGTPSSNKTFAYVQNGSAFVGVTQAPATMSGTKGEIKKIYLFGTKRAGFQVCFQTKGFNGLNNNYIEVENAIASGEMKSFGMTSDEALAELKKQKDKLDLGLISQSSYDSSKAELAKYIK